MRIAVLGAGIVGVTAAYELLKEGHAVTLVERAAAPGHGTSYGNAGFISPGHAYAWATPKAPMMLLKSLWRNDLALRFKPSLDPDLWRWTAGFLRECTWERAMANTARKVALCIYSQGELRRIAEETGIGYDNLRTGCLYIFRTEAAYDTGIRKSKALTDHGIEVRPINMAAAAEIDPALSPIANKFVGALYTPADETGDCHAFTRRLADKIADMGATVRYGTTVTALDPEGDRIVRARTDQGDITADAFVLSLGPQSARLARGIGVNLPIYPIKGYSFTATINARGSAPTVGAIDEENLIAYARYGDRLRVTATAEFAGYSTDWRPSDFRHMQATIRDLFPDGADYEHAEYWAGLRPMTPNGAPRYGRARHKNLWFNTGQGHMGWTMAAGSARIIADLIAGRPPAIDLEGMRVA